MAVAKKDQKIQSDPYIINVSGPSAKCLPTRQFPIWRQVSITVVATERRQSGLRHRKIVDLPVLMEHFEIHNRTEGKCPRTVE